MKLLTSYIIGNELIKGIHTLKICNELVRQN